MTATATKVPSDIAIAQAAKLRPIRDVAAELGLSDDEVELYGKYKAKISLRALETRQPRGRLVLVTGINPTPAGEGKSTVTVGVTQALRKLGRNAALCIREPSLGPVFGVKGGAAGGGYAQVVPMEDINLHFTGDFHAIASAHNLLSALLDAHLHHGNALGLDTRRITWPRTIDMNDRALRNVIVGLGGLNAGPAREERFVIIPGSEIMAIMALATGIEDLEQRLARIIVGLTSDKQPVRARDLKADVDAVKRGAANVRRHIRNVKKFGVPVVVALNRFLTDTDAELDAVRAECAAEGVGVELCEVWEKGGEGGVAVAEAVLKLLEVRTAKFKPLYDEKRPIREKIETVAKDIYGAGAVAFAPAAERALEQLPGMGLGETA